MIENRRGLTIFSHAMLIMGIFLVIILTVVQFRYVESKVRYQ